jgi:hypothetical protein
MTIKKLKVILPLVWQATVLYISISFTRIRLVFSEAYLGFLKILYCLIHGHPPSGY